MLRRAQPTTSDGTSRHHSTRRTALSILTTNLSTTTQAHRPQDPQNTARYGARQAGRHEHEHRTSEQEQHPAAPIGSTGTRQGGLTGPCHRQGVVHMNGTSKTGRTATEHRKIPDDGLCMQHCQGRAGTRAPNGENISTVVRSLVITFLPRGGQTAHGENVPCRPHATSASRHRNQQNTCTQQIRLRERLLQRQGTNGERTDQEATNTTAHQQNRYSEHKVTTNRPYARRPTPNWQDMHGPVRERHPTGWRHRGEPRPPTTMTTNTAKHLDSTTAGGGNQRSQTTLHYTWTNQDATNQRRHERAGYMGRI